MPSPKSATNSSAWPILRSIKTAPRESRCLTAPSPCATPGPGKRRSSRIVCEIVRILRSREWGRSRSLQRVRHELHCYPDRGGRQGRKRSRNLYATQIGPLFSCLGGCILRNSHTSSRRLGCAGAVSHWSHLVHGTFRLEARPARRSHCFGSRLVAVCGCDHGSATARVASEILQSSTQSSACCSS